MKFEVEIIWIVFILDSFELTKASKIYDRADIKIISIIQKEYDKWITNTKSKCFKKTNK